MYKPKEKTSYGIACCRYVNNQWEILMIKKRITYAFNNFVNGKYKSNNNAEIIRLLSGMTIEEKLDLLSLNFNQIWYRLWLNKKISLSHFAICKNKFNNAFTLDGGSRLNKLIKKSTNANYIWEIPKGQKSTYESNIECAIREFSEETSITKDLYKIFLESKQYSYIDDGIKYTNIFYIGCINNNKLLPSISCTNRHQYTEISDIKWMNINLIKSHVSHNALINIIDNIFAYLKKNKKKCINYNVNNTHNSLGVRDISCDI